MCMMERWSVCECLKERESDGLECAKVCVGECVRESDDTNVWGKDSSCVCVWVWEKSRERESAKWRFVLSSHWATIQKAFFMFQNGFNVQCRFFLSAHFIFTPILWLSLSSAFTLSFSLSLLKLIINLCQLSPGVSVKVSADLDITRIMTFYSYCSTIGTYLLGWMVGNFAPRYQIESCYLW